jgi:type VI secretion system lysozyme-like protein
MSEWAKERAAARADASGTVWGSRARTMAGSLFERLIVDEEEISLDWSGDLTDGRVRSIKRNLGRILNTRAGGAAANSALGVGDFNDGVMRSSDPTKHICASIRECILANEPRISDVDVEHIPDLEQPLSPRFSIVASILVSGRKEQIRVDLAMLDGRFVPANSSKIGS